MLILTRRTGESIVIGNDVTVTVLEVRGDQIRVGVDAPRSVQVHREEVYRQIEAQNTQAAKSAARTRQMVARMPRNAARGDGRPPSDSPTSGQSTQQSDGTSSGTSS